MRWLRRPVYVFLFLLWLAVMVFPCAAFTLAMQQQILVGDSERSHVRIFLLQEEEKEGVGLEWERPYRVQSGCYLTTVTYLMWSGEGDNTAYCQCFDLQTGDLLSSNPQSCQLP